MSINIIVHNSKLSLWLVNNTIMSIVLMKYGFCTVDQQHSRFSAVLQRHEIGSTHSYPNRYLAYHHISVSKGSLHVFRTDHTDLTESQNTPPARIRSLVFSLPREAENLVPDVAAEHRSSLIRIDHVKNSPSRGMILSSMVIFGQPIILNIGRKCA